MSEEQARHFFPAFRVFVFGTDEHREAWIGSADMMHRNLDRRVEALVRMRDPRHVDELFELMAKGMSGDYAHWSLRGDGRWTRQHRGEEELLPDVQAQLIAMYAKRRRKARR